MSRDVVGQLQGISSQQMKIQNMRNKLAVFREASAKEEDMFRQLLLVRRVPVAYRQCLAECMRRCMRFPASQYGMWLMPFRRCCWEDGGYAFAGARFSMRKSYTAPPCNNLQAVL